MRNLERGKFCILTEGIYAEETQRRQEPFHGAWRIRLNRIDFKNKGV
jgi:hypothetical protein